MLEAAIRVQNGLARDTVRPLRQSHWSKATRVMFRFVFSYLCLYYVDCASILASFLGGAIGSKSRSISEFAWGKMAPFVGIHLLHVQKTIQVRGGDSTYEYLVTFCELTLALVATVVWSMLDGKRAEYGRLHQWLRLAVQLLLAAVMFSYGFQKVFPLQFGRLMPSALSTQLGDMNQQDVLWNFMSASIPYQIFCGAAEVLGGLLLLVPRLATIGAALCFTPLLNIFVLNVAYDVWVKHFSFHLLLLSLFLLAPELPQLTAFLVFRRQIAPRAVPSLSDHLWIDKEALVAFWLFGLFFFGVFGVSSWRNTLRREEVAKQPLYGVWIVDKMEIAGDPKGSLFSDAAKAFLHLSPGDDKWKRVVFESSRWLEIDCINGAAEMVPFTLNANQDTLALSKNVYDSNFAAKLAIERVGTQLIKMKGVVNGLNMSAELHKLSTSKFRLMNSRVHWVTD